MASKSMSSKTKAQKSSSPAPLASTRATSKPELKEHVPDRDGKALEESELEKLAVEALLQEAKQSKIRAEQSGALGWQKCPLPRANKRFINNLVMSDLNSNKRRKIDPSRSPGPEHLPMNKHKGVSPESELS